MIEVIKKNIQFALTLFSLFAFLFNLYFDIQNQGVKIDEIQAQIKEIEQRQNLKDVNEAETNIKLQNIENSLEEIKQDLKK